MKTVLLSAYACFGNYGSEPGVGYQWLSALLKKEYKVTLATSGWSYSKLCDDPIMGNKNLKIIVIGEEKYDFLFRKNRAFYQFYLIYFQYSLYKHLKGKRAHFDIVHHITYGGVTIPSFVAKQGEYSIYGPVGGAEAAPLSLGLDSGIKALLKEIIKKAMQKTLRVSPLLVYTQLTYDRILLKNKDNENFYFLSKQKCKVKSEISVSKKGCVINGPVNDGIKRIGFSARGIYWKGGAFAVKLAKEINNKNGRSSYEFHFYGEGKEFHRWRSMASGEENIIFHGRLERNIYLDKLNKLDVLWFPSYHDSSGNVVLEALAKGIPVIAFDLGGPTSITSEDRFIVNTSQSIKKIKEEYIAKTVIAANMTDCEKIDMAIFYRKKFNRECLLEGVY